MLMAAANRVGGMAADLSCVESLSPGEVPWGGREARRGIVARWRIILCRYALDSGSKAVTVAGKTQIRA